MIKVILHDVSGAVHDHVIRFRRLLTSSVDVCACRKRGGISGCCAAHALTLLSRAAFRQMRH